MKKISKRQVNITLKLVLIFLAIAGVIAQSFMGVLISPGLTTFLYYTTQSNIILAISTLALLIYDVLKKEKPRFLISFFHIAVSATTLTFIVFALFLGPYISNVNYFYSLQNLTLHNIVPLLGIAVYFLEEKRAQENARICALISPLSYMIVTYILHFLNVKFGNELFPYFFLNYIEYGWFRIDSPSFGVVYWWILISLLYTSISYLLYFLKTKNEKSNIVGIVSMTILCIFAAIFIIINIIIKM